MSNPGTVDGPYMSREAGADLSSSQYFGVKLNSDDEVILVTANDKDCIGILQNKPTEGETASIKFGGTSLVKISEAVTIGARLTPTAQGDFEEVDAADEAYQCKALQTGAADGDLIEAMLQFGESNTSDA